jgi:predicted outer membrane repeat protein
MYFKMTRATVTVAGGAAALCLGSVPAALAASASSTYFVPCSPYALDFAIGHAHYGETLDLAPGCTYYLPEALPTIKTTLTIVGNQSTLTRTRDAESFSLLTVGGGGCGGLGTRVLNGNAVGDCSVTGLTVINVNFTDGGGSDTDEGGAIDSRGRLYVEGGTFSDNNAGEYGGAIYNAGHMTVNNATFTGNLAPYGGAIYNRDDASIGGSSFTWNKAPNPYGDLDNSDGGAIYNDEYMYLANSGFLANSTGGNGGAIYSDDDLHASHITVVANAAGFEAGGIYNGEDGNVTLLDSTVFGNQPDNCYEVPGCF